MSASELEHVAELVLRDFAASGARFVFMGRSWEATPGQTMGWLGVADDDSDSAAGIHSLRDAGQAGNLASVADQVQDFASEVLALVTGNSTWPPCPQHPDRHPLQARVVAGDAVWRCPVSGAVAAPVGRLAGTA
jgi:hypothetical protein